jgi:hypothetical protein
MRACSLHVANNATLLEDIDVSEIQITAQIYQDGHAMHRVPISTGSSRPKCSGDQIIWNEWIEIPIKVRDLSRTAKLVSKSVPVSSATSRADSPSTGYHNLVVRQYSSRRHIDRLFR